MYLPGDCSIHSYMNWPRKRSFRLTKLGQVARLAWESHVQPMAGESGVPQHVEQGELGVMFLGHSSFLLQFGGRNVLVDPVFADRLVILRRQRRAGVLMADLPRIDVVLITHAHMDHLNRPTLRKLARVNRNGRAPVVVLPHDCADLVEGMGFSKVQTLCWWEETMVAGLRITATPAKHWGARMFKDTHRGFGGYVMADDAGYRVYHSGDTAYFNWFREIALRLGPFDVALLPIGAYFPDSYRAVHTSPEDALRAFTELDAELMVPMHFGTFRLGREPMEEPPIRLMAEAVRLGVEQRVRVLAEGETVKLSAPIANGKVTTDSSRAVELFGESFARERASKAS